MGADLIRRVNAADAFVLVTPLLEASNGAKMGKSSTGTVWLDAAKTPPFEYFQWFRNLPDEDVQRFMACFTFLPMEEVHRLTAAEGADLNRAKEILAFEATTILHGEEAARQALEAARALFGDGASSANVPTTEVDVAELDGGIVVTELFKRAGLVSSANEARSLISQGGLSINGEPVADPRAQISVDALQDGGLMLSRGKKRHMRVTVRN
jgi:tyrosyl-tRNA synthetase